MILTASVASGHCFGSGRLCHPLALTHHCSFPGRQWSFSEWVGSGTDGLPALTVLWPQQWPQLP